MANRFRVSSILPRKLEELGPSPTVVLRQPGVPLGWFDQQKILVTTEEMFARTAEFLKLAVILPSDPNLRVNDYCIWRYNFEKMDLTRLEESS